MMRTVILAAGHSRRFQEAGYKVPKPFLSIFWRGTALTMIEHVINTIPLDSNIFIGVPPGWLNEAIVFSAAKAKRITCRAVDSNGPADTAFQILDKLPPENTLILDSDVLNFTNDLIRLSSLPVSSVLVRKSTNPTSSYVDNLGVFKHIVEKKTISQYAVQGAYFIPLVHYTSFIEALRTIIPIIKEPYLSHALDHMVCEKYSLHVSYTPIEWGTPRDIRISGAHIVEREAENVRDRCS